MRKFLAAVTVCLAATSIATAADTTLLEAAESGDRATALRLLAAKGTNVNALGADGTTAAAIRKIWRACHSSAPPAGCWTVLWPRREWIARNAT